ncbi:MAG: hypothetical protein HYY17_02455 [Planctomycetes bacterium]|nr:hypothetical protein [Planctomycetota bacterium]
MEDWKVERRKKRCTVCERVFASEEELCSCIVEAEGAFSRRDLCLACWERRTSEPFSFWRTRMPRIRERKLEDIGAMVEFFKRLVAAPSEDPLRRKITYLVALILMRKKRLKLAGVRAAALLVEKSWDGDVAEIPEPAIGDEELQTLRVEMEKLFDVELAAEAAA